FANQVVHVPSRNSVIEQRPVAFTHGVPIHSMHSGVVKIVAFQAPCFREQLFPFGDGIDQHFKAAGRQFLFHFLAFLDVNDGVIIFFANKHFLAFIRERRLIRILDDRFLFALIEVIIFDRRLFVRKRARAGQPSINQLVRYRGQISVVTCLGRQYHQPPFKIVQIDLNGLGRFFFLRNLFALVFLFILITVIFFLLVLFPVAVLVGFLILLFVFVAFLVISRRQERRHIFAQRYGHKIHGV